MAANSKLVNGEKLRLSAIEMCRQHKLWSEWQPLLFAGILCYQQGKWLKCFDYFSYSAMEGNLIAMEFLLACAKREPIASRFDTLMKLNPTLKTDLTQYREFTPHYSIAKAWRLSSLCYYYYRKCGNQTIYAEIKEKALATLKQLACHQAKGLWASYLLAVIYKGDHQLRNEYLLKAAQAGSFHAMQWLDDIQFFHSCFNVSSVLAEFAIAKQVVGQAKGALELYLGETVCNQNWYILAANMGANIEPQLLETKLSPYCFFKQLQIKRDKQVCQKSKDDDSLTTLSCAAS